LATDTVLDRAAEPRINVVRAPFTGLQDTLRACATPMQLQCHARVVDLLKPRTVHTALNQDSTGPGMGFLPHAQPSAVGVSAWLQRLVLARCVLGGCVATLGRRAACARREPGAPTRPWCLSTSASCRACFRSACSCGGPAPGPRAVCAGLQLYYAIACSRRVCGIRYMRRADGGVDAHDNVCVFAVRQEGHGGGVR
jgi:hypothetical protein